MEVRWAFPLRQAGILPALQNITGFRWEGHAWEGRGTVKKNHSVPMKMMTCMPTQIICNMAAWHLGMQNG